MKRILVLLCLAILTITLGGSPPGGSARVSVPVIAVASVITPVVDTEPMPVIDEKQAPLPLATIAKVPVVTPLSVAAVPEPHLAYLTAMYVSVVPAAERAALDGRYVFGYDLPGLACGTGCSGLFGGQARSSFDASFFALSTGYQRNTLAHEAAHAYGFLYLPGYTTESWQGSGGWMTQFHDAAAGFVRTYDAEAWAACVAWQETGFNNRIDQVRGICTGAAAAIAMDPIDQG
jgi:hypothetical protein